jgi:hypothetical protein
MISTLAINYSDILIMERHLHVFADPVNNCFQEEVDAKLHSVWKGKIELPQINTIFVPGVYVCILMTSIPALRSSSGKGSSIHCQFFGHPEDVLPV